MLHSIQEGIEAIKNGQLVIVVDDEDRENEGDFITAARNVTPDIINFMSKEGRGLICAPISEEIAEKLQLNLMVNQNTALHETPFTVSVAGPGTPLPRSTSTPPHPLLDVVRLSTVTVEPFTTSPL